MKFPENCNFEIYFYLKRAMTFDPFRVMTFDPAYQNEIK